MYLKFQNPQHPNIDLYFIKNVEFVETIPMDLTSFIVWHLEKNRDLTDFFNRFNTLEYSNVIPDIVSRFIDYLFIHETAEALLTISQELNDFILNQENITNNEIRVQVVNCFADLEFENILIATERNNLIWNYLPNEIQNNEQILQFQPISFEEERQQLSAKSEIDFDFCIKLMQSFEAFGFKIPNLLWYTSPNNSNHNYLVNEHNNVIIEIDHNNKDIWLLKSECDTLIQLTHGTINETNLIYLFQIYFMSDDVQLNVLKRRLNSDNAFFNPLWLNAANYTPKQTGEYARIHWDIIKQELNIL